MKIFLSICLLLRYFFVTAQQPYVSKAWSADNKDGYKNPILFADYSDPGICRRRYRLCQNR